MIAASFIGFALSSANPMGIALSVVMPAIAMRQSRRRAAYTAGAIYYATALWPLLPGARNFFGPDASVLVAVGLWALSFLVLALPWLLIWSPRRGEAIWRAPVGIALTVIPPVGIIGWASPLIAAGILFPGAAWWGLLLCAVQPGLWPSGRSELLRYWPLLPSPATPRSTRRARRQTGKRSTRHSAESRTATKIQLPSMRPLSGFRRRR